MEPSQPNQPNQRHCPSCNTLVLRLQNAVTGQHTLVDTEPSADGYLVVHADQGVYEVLTERHRTIFDTLVGTLHTTHFATCTASADWRRPSSTAITRTR